MPDNDAVSGPEPGAAPGQAETPGERLYERYQAAMHGLGLGDAVNATWDELCDEQRAWEALAAQPAQASRPRWTERLGPVIACDHGEQLAALAAEFDARAAEPDRDRVSAAAWRIAARSLRERIEPGAQPAQAAPTFTGDVTFTWDYRQPAPMDEIASAVHQLSGGTVIMTMPSTETDEYALTVAPAKPEAAQAASGDAWPLSELRDRATRALGANPVCPGCQQPYDPARGCLRTCACIGPAPGTPAQPMPGEYDAERAGQAAPGTAAELSRIREMIRVITAELEHSAAATAPSRKSDIETRIAVQLRALLDGQP